MSENYADPSEQIELLLDAFEVVGAHGVISPISTNRCWRETRLPTLIGTKPPSLPSTNFPLRALPESPLGANWAIATDRRPRQPFGEPNTPGNQAKIVTPLMLKRMLRHTSCSPFPLRDRALVLLSMKAGLCACEIASLDWSMVLDARGKVDDAIADTPQCSRITSMAPMREVSLDGGNCRVGSLTDWL